MSECWFEKSNEPFGTNTKTKNEKCIYLLFFLVQIEIKWLLALPPIEQKKSLMHLALFECDEIKSFIASNMVSWEGLKTYIRTAVLPVLVTSC